MKSPLRLDRYLAHQYPRLSRSQIKKLIDAGHVTVNGAVVKAGTAVKPGLKIDIRFPPPQPATLEPEGIPLNILYEDRDILVLNKPPGMVVQPAPGHPRGTLMNALLNHWREEPRITHRLDKGTSGVMVVAKNEASYRELARQFKEREVEKSYLALVWGRGLRPFGVLSSFLGRHPRHRQKFSRVTTRGRWSVTEWRIKETFKEWALLVVHPKTGRTHQIRVHLAESGMPIVGDPLYGGARALPKGTGEEVRGELARFGRQALHALSLSFHHPGNGRWMTFNAPLAPDMRELIDVLRGS